MAEEEGFEPPGPFDPQVFKTRALNRALPLFRKDLDAIAPLSGLGWGNRGRKRPDKAAAPKKMEGKEGIEPSPMKTSS